MFLNSEAATAGVLQKQGTLKSFSKLTGNHLCWSLFFNKVAGPRLAILLIKDPNTAVFLLIL